MEKWDYAVTLREVQAKDERDPLVKNRMACVAEDTGEVLGLVSKRYRLIQNKTLYNIMENLGAQLGLKLYQINVCKNRALTSFQYSFGEQHQTIIESSALSNDVVQFGVEIINTFDRLGGLPTGCIRFNARRLACLNGMTLLKEFARITFQDFPELNLPNLKKVITDRTERVVQQAKTWQEWARFTPQRLKVSEFVGTRFSKRASVNILERYDDGLEKSLWSLYNLITAYITHELKSRNPDNLRLKQLDAGRIESAFYTNEWK